MYYAGQILERTWYGEDLILIIYWTVETECKKTWRFGLLSVDDLPLEIYVTDVNVCFNINYLSLENSAIDIMVEDFSINQHGQMAVNGQSVLLKFSQLSNLEKCIQTIYLLHRNQRHAYFQIQYIDAIVGGDSN